MYCFESQKALKERESEREDICFFIRTRNVKFENSNNFTEKYKNNI